MALKMRFILLDRQKELVISILTECTIKSIRGNSLHTAFELNIHCKRNYIVKIDIKWS